MTNLLRTLKGEPVATMAIVTATIGVATILGAPEKIMGSIAILIGALLAFPIRSGVTPVADAVTATKEAAAAAAANVAESLNSHSAGALGTITEEAAIVAATAADDASNTALKAIGVSKKARTT